MRLLLVLCLSSSAFAITVRDVCGTTGGTVTIDGTSYTSVAYSAVGNGSTTDNTLVQAALNAVVDGDIAYWKPSCLTAITVSAVTISGKRVLIRGSGKGSGIKATGTSSTATNTISGFTHMKISSCTGCEIKNMEFDMNSVGGTGLDVFTCTNCLIQGNEIHHGVHTQSGALAVIGHGTGNRIIGNYIHDSTGTAGNEMRGFWVGNSGDFETDVQLLNNYAYNTAMTPFPMVVVGASYAIGNSCYETSTVGGGACIKWEPPTGNTSTLRVYSTYAYNTDQGIQVDSTAGNLIVKGLYHFGNRSANGDNGIYVTGGALTGGLTASYLTCERGDSSCVYMLSINGPVDISNVIAYGAGVMNNGIIIDHLASGKTAAPVTINRVLLENIQFEALHTSTSGGTINNMTVSNSVFRNMPGGVYSWYLGQISGTISNVTSTNNCWTANSTPSQNLSDSRGTLANVGNSGSCPVLVTPKPAAMIAAAL